MSGFEELDGQSARKVDRIAFWQCKLLMFKQKEIVGTQVRALPEGLAEGCQTTDGA